MSTLQICKYCESEYEELEFNLDNWCCDGMRADLLEAENARLKKAARNMIDKLNKIQNDSNFIGIFQMANIHGLQYNGENYSKEYDELLAILEEHEKGT